MPSKLIIVPYMAQIWRDEIKLNYFRRIGYRFIAHVTATDEWFTNNKETGYIIRELDYSHIVKGKINPDKLFKAISKYELCTLIYEFNDVYIFFVNLSNDTDFFLFSCEFPEFTISKLTDHA